MMQWGIRESLSHSHKLRRSYYEMLRDELDQQMIQYALVDSYLEFKAKRVPYPFVEKRELKPRARIPDVEHELHNSFLVLFVEDTVPAIHKKYLRFLKMNKTTKTNLLRSKSLSLNSGFDRSRKYLDAAGFDMLLKTLLPLDLALLIQQDPVGKTKSRYALSHFHVKIDWPVADAAEDLGKFLRYISKDLYEKGDHWAEDLQKKYFEYYGLSSMAGGRRTAAIVAAQYLRQLPCISTVYAGSSESRALFRLSERGVAKYVLVRFSREEMADIAAKNGMTLRSFIKHYAVSTTRRAGVCIFQVSYYYTEHARPPADGKLRELKPDLNWLSVWQEYLMPKPGSLHKSPLAFSWIYSL